MPIVRGDPTWRGAEVAMTGSQRFPFVASARPVVIGGVGGVVVTVLFFAGAVLAGRITDLDGAHAAGIAGSLVVGLAVGVVPRLRASRDSARALGAIEVDELGVRWRRGDGTLGFEAPWESATGAVLDARRRHLVLVRADGSSVVIGVVGAHGAPAGDVVLPGFDEIVAICRSRLAIEGFEGAKNLAAARRVAAHGGMALAVAAALHAIDRELLAVVPSLGAIAIAIPGVTAILGAVLVLAAARIGLGHGPLLSPLYAPVYAAQVRRVLLIAVIANLAAALALYALE